jgi:hypothetical protein
VVIVPTMVARPCSAGVKIGSGTLNMLPRLNNAALMKTTAHRRTLAATLGVLLLCGCDLGTGVIRTVSVKALPTSEQVEAALRELPAGLHAKPFADNGNQSWNCDWFTIQLCQARKGKKSIVLSWISMGGPTPRAAIEPTRKRMDEFYAILRKHVPDLPPATSVVEELVRIYDN